MQLSPASSRAGEGRDTHRQGRRRAGGERGGVCASIKRGGGGGARRAAARASTQHREHTHDAIGAPGHQPHVEVLIHLLPRLVARLVRVLGHRPRPPPPTPERSPCPERRLHAWDAAKHIRGAVGRGAAGEARDELVARRRHGSGAAPPAEHEPATLPQVPGLSPPSSSCPQACVCYFSVVADSHEPNGRENVQMLRLQAEG